MRTIHKYALELHTREQIVNLPEAAELLDIQIQNDALYLWAAVFTDVPLAPRLFQIFLTGQQLPDDRWARHVATLQSNELVLHFYEMKSMTPNPTVTRSWIR